MTSVKNPYDTLYDSLKDTFTVSLDGCNCTLGDYMLIKAGKRQTSASNLPAATAHEDRFSTIVDYVSHKLTVKAAPQRERTIRRFPVRSSMSAIYTAVASCALVFSLGLFALNGKGLVSPNTAELPDTEISETEIVEAETSENK